VIPIFLLTAALAAVPDNARCLLGTWSFDADRSESLKPILERRGAPWFVRSLGDALPHTMTFAEDGDRVRMGVHSSVKDADEILDVDDVERTVTTPKGDAAINRHRFTSDGSLQSILTGALADGQTGTLTVTRSCVGTGMEMLYALALPDGSVMVARRMYRRE